MKKLKYLLIFLMATSLYGQRKQTWPSTTFRRVSSHVPFFVIADSLVLQDSSSSFPIFLIRNVNDDGNSGILKFLKDTDTPSDNDEIGIVTFFTNDSAGNEVRLATIRALMEDMTTADIASSLTFTLMMDSSYSNMLYMSGYEGTVGEGVFVVNDSSRDVNIRFESDSDANAFFLDGGTSKTGFNTDSPDSTVTADGMHSSGGLVVDLHSKTTTFQMTTGADNLDVLQSDASGIASWVTLTAAGAMLAVDFGDSLVNYDGDGIVIINNDAIDVLVDYDGGIEIGDDSLNIKLDGATLTLSSSGIKVTDSYDDDFLLRAEFGDSLTNYDGDGLAIADLDDIDILLDYDGGLETTDDSVNIKLDGATLTLSTSGLKVADTYDDGFLLEVDFGDSLVNYDGDGIVITNNDAIDVLVDYDGGIEIGDDSLNIKLDGSTLTLGTSGIKATSSNFTAASPLAVTNSPQIIGASASEISLTIAKDLVVSAPLTGGENNVFPGAEADVSVGADTSTGNPNLSTQYFVTSKGYITATLTEEEVEDYVGGMVTGNTETNIAVTYEDGDGTIDFVVSDVFVLKADSTDHSADHYASRSALTDTAAALRTFIGGDYLLKTAFGDSLVNYDGDGIKITDLDDIDILLDYDGALETTDDSINVKLDGSTLSKSSSGLKVNAISTTEITNSTILEIDLKAVDEAVDEDILTYEDATGDFEWHTPSELITDGTNISWSSTTLNVDDAFLINSGTDTTTGTIVSAGITITTGNSLTLGTTQWDNGADSLDGEIIAANTIDDDALDFSDITLADFTDDVGFLLKVAFGDSLVLYDGDGILITDLDAIDVLVDFDGSIEITDDSLNVKLDGATLTSSASGLKVTDGDYLIGSAGTAYQVWKSDGSAAGFWGWNHWLDASDGDPDSVVYVDATGKVGIGTTSPDEKLDIRDGKVYLSDADVAHSRTDILPTAVFGSVEILSATKGGLLIRGYSDLGTGGGLKFAGNIGSTDPTDTEPVIAFLATKNDGASSVTAIGASETAIGFDVNADGTSEIVMLGSGNVGIGLIDPDSPLEVLSTSVQLKLSYDGSNYGTAGAGVSGDVTFAASGGDFSFSDDNITTTADVTGDTAFFDVYSNNSSFKLGRSGENVEIDAVAIFNNVARLDSIDTPGSPVVGDLYQNNTNIYYYNGSGWDDLTAGAGDLSDYLKKDGSVALTANWDAGAYEIRAETFESDVATSTAPFTIASETMVDNLNADLLDGEEATAFEDADADLTALAALSGTGVVVRTGAQTYTERTLTGTGNEIEIASGDGVAGNPTIGLPDNVTIGTNLTVTGSTFAGDYIKHGGDLDTYMYFTPDDITFAAGGEDFIFMLEDGSQDYIKIGDNGDIDVNIASGMDGAIFVQGSTANVGINIKTPARDLHVDGYVRISTESEPGSPAAGDIYQDGTDLFYYGDGAWVDLTAAAAGDGDITGVAVTAPITGGGTTGEITIGADTTSGNPNLATQYFVSSGYQALDTDFVVGDLGAGVADRSLWFAIDASDATERIYWDESETDIAIDHRLRIVDYDDGTDKWGLKVVDDGGTYNATLNADDGHHGVTIGYDGGSGVVEIAEFYANGGENYLSMGAPYDDDIINLNRASQTAISYQNDVTGVGSGDGAYAGLAADGGFNIYHYEQLPIRLYTKAQLHTYFHCNGMVGIGTETFAAETYGSVLAIANADTIPSAGTANQSYMYAKDVTASSEMHVMDEGGNETKISPHNPETGEWEFYSKNVETGRVVKVDLERFFRDFDERFGTDYFQEFTEGVKDETE